MSPASDFMVADSWKLPQEMEQYTCIQNCEMTLPKLSLGIFSHYPLKNGPIYLITECQMFPEVDFKV